MPAKSQNQITHPSKEIPQAREATETVLRRAAEAFAEAAKAWEQWRKTESASPARPAPQAHVGSTPPQARSAPDTLSPARSAPAGSIGRDETSRPIGPQIPSPKHPRDQDRRDANRS